MNSKHIEIAKKLIDQSNNKIFTVISNSMSPLINKGDQITCSPADIFKIKKYSLIAFNNDLNHKTVPTVHRVIKISKTKNSVIFKTKGDLNFICDKADITQDNIIGIVSKITKNNRTILLDTVSGKCLSLFLYFASTIKNYTVFLLAKTLNFFYFFVLPEKQPEYINNLKTIHQSILTNTQDWTKAAKINATILNFFIGKGIEVCDVSFEGGYCEESFNFIRQGFKISHAKILPDYFSDRKYDLIICSKVLNLAENKQKRQEVYDFLKQILKKNGYALLSYINKKNNCIISLKRQIFSLSKIYKGPKKDDLVYNGFFVMKNLSPEHVIKELSYNNFFTERKFVSGNIVSLLVKINIK